MSQPAAVVRSPLNGHPAISAEAALGARALWMLGVSVMVGVVVVAGLAGAALTVKMAS